jgi:ribosomal-protein-alanine N-acetyltransferase
MDVLTREALSGCVDDLIALDRAALEEAWGSPEFLLELPGKWELSRLLLDGSGRVAGFAIASIKSPGIHIHRLVVSSELRGGGLGYAFLKSIAADAAARGVPSLTLKVGLSNDGARRFYEKLGFEESGRDSKNATLAVGTNTLLTTGQAR